MAGRSRNLILAAMILAAVMAVAAVVARLELQAGLQREGDVTSEPVPA
jgi:hypothetical protein